MNDHFTVARCPYCGQSITVIQHPEGVALLMPHGIVQSTYPATNRCEGSGKSPR